MSKVKTLSFSYLDWCLDTFICMKSIRNCDNYSNLLRVNSILLHVWLHLKYFLKNPIKWK